MDSERRTSSRLPTGRAGGAGIAFAFGLFLVVFSTGLAVGGEVGDIMLAGVEPLPFTILAVLAYLGVDRRWARVATVMWLFLLVFGVTLAALALSNDAITRGGQTGSPASPIALGAVAAGSLVALLLGMAGFVRGFRVALSRILPIDPNSFVHAVALVAVASLTLLSLVPLLVLGEPPLLASLAGPEGGLLEDAGANAGLLRQDLYGLAWMIPAVVFAVGFGIRRELREALVRLGLVRPTGGQIMAGLALGVATLVASQLLSIGVESLWMGMGWPLTDEAALSKLIAYTLSPVGAVVMGVTAGLGEELAVRGVLQPRLGLVMSNLFFTALHALQYNWDALVSVFLLGLLFGVVRQRANTSTSAIVHGFYDFLVTMVVILEIPWFQ